MSLLATLTAWLVLLALHECAHAFAAYRLGLRVYGLGVSLRPVPHVYVQADYSPSARKRWWFYAAGPLSTFALFVLFLCSPWHPLWLARAFVIMLILESNPFFSDFTLLYTINQLHRGKTHSAKQVREQFLFSPKWYIWFGGWMLYIYSLLKWVQTLV